MEKNLAGEGNFLSREILEGAIYQSSIMLRDWLESKYGFQDYKEEAWSLNSVCKCVYNGPTKQHIHHSRRPNAWNLVDMCAVRHPEAMG